jgi:hypothetical protein
MNIVAMVYGHLRYVTALGETDSETSSNCWKLRVISVASPSVYLVVISRLVRLGWRFESHETSDGNDRAGRVAS